MNTRNQDLREALRQVNPTPPQLSDDFAERLEQALNTSHPTSWNEKCEVKSETWWRKAAAMFLGLLITSGLVLAAIRLAHSPQPSPQQPCLVGGDSIAANGTEAPTDSLVGFDDQPLGMLLSTVATHYAHAVVFASDSLRQLRITTTWNRREPLAAFLESLNELDGLHLTAQDNTIYVETKTEEGVR